MKLNLLVTVCDIRDFLNYGILYCGFISKLTVALNGGFGPY